MRSARRPTLRLECLEGRVVPATSLLSVNTGGTDAGDQRTQIVADANDPTQDSSREVSADGRYVLFQSFAQDLIPGGGTGGGVLYVRDRVANSTTAVSILPNGTLTEGGDASISANGKVVVFTAGNGKLYARDLQAQTTAQVTVQAGGAPATGGAGPGGYGASISDDGRFVAFNYLSNDLVANDTNGKNDIFVRDLTGGTTSLVSHTPSGAVGNDDSIEGVISGDGNTVVFRSLATDLTSTSDTNAAYDLFAYNVASGTVSLISSNLAGTATGDKGVGFSYRVDGTGTKVVFVSSSTDLTADANVVDAQLFARDLTSGTTRLLTIRPDGNPLTGTIQQPAISDDGRFVTFSTNFSLSPDPSPNATQVYVVELATGQLTLASRTPDGTGANGGVTGFPVLSGDGRYVVYESDAANLVPDVTLGGSGNKRTLFVYDREADTTVALSTNPAGTQTIPVVNVRFAVARDGSTVFFTTIEAGYGPTDTNGVEDVYAADIPVLSPPPAPGAHITSAQFSGSVANTFNSVVVAFNEDINSSSFTTADVALTGPGGAINVTGVTPVTGSTTEFIISFQAQSAPGTYTITVGPDVLDVAGNAMDQNENGTNGEGGVAPAGDQFQTSSMLAAAPAGPHITSGAFTDGGTPGAFVAVVVAFDRAIDTTSFTASDVTVTGPNGAIPVTGLTLDSGTGGTRFTLSFAPQSTPGNYTVTVGPDVLDTGGLAMDQNQNGINGESPGDQFTTTGILAAPPPFLAVGNFGGTVHIVNSSTGTVISTIRPLDAGSQQQYTGIVEVALGDFNGDSIPDLLVAAADPVGLHGLASSKAGKVFVFDGATLAAGGVPSSPFRTFTPFATTSGPAGTTGAFTNGLNIATGDVDGDGQVDLVAGTRGITGGVGRAEFGRLVVIDGTSPAGTNTIIGGIQTPFGAGYQKGVVVAAGNADGTGGDEIAVTRGGPVNSKDPVIQQIKVKVLQLQGGSLTELHLNADGSTSFAPFGSLSGPANAIKRDGRVAFLDADGDGTDELVFTALDPLTNASNQQVRVGVYAINPAASTGAATIVSMGSDAGTYLTGSAVVDHAITHVAGTGAAENLALLTESAASGVAYLDPLSGTPQAGGFALSLVHGGITIDGV